VAAIGFVPEKAVEESDVITSHRLIEIQLPFFQCFRERMFRQFPAQLASRSRLDSAGRRKNVHY
jgi:hypothetical protein